MVITEVQSLIYSGEDISGGGDERLKSKREV